ncbi:MAG TPA: helix-turn-helix transcriptional regulator [Actinomycetota bacterium]|nr:helix-turn-helix transcriptional regulator [Actinomycetota bacterium]
MATDFASIARVLANPNRAAMVDRLMDGVPVTAGELARAAGVSPSTASDHLAQLQRAGLVTATKAGRRRYFRLGGPGVAEALEAFAQLCPPRDVRSLRQARDAHDVAYLRTCYDHLAGAVAVALAERLQSLGWLRFDDAPVVTSLGAARFASIGVDVEAARAARRAFARQCLDWTERRPHLAGALGAAVAEAFFDNGWIRRRPSGRGVTLTADGVSELHARFGLRVEAPAGPSSGRRPSRSGARA